MTNSSSLDQYKVPAFQRKRSLSAKARKKQVPRTALERLQAGVPFVKPKRAVTRRVVRRRAVGSSSTSGYSGYSSEPSYSSGLSYGSPLVDEAPTYESPSRYLGSSYGSESSLFSGDDEASRAVTSSYSSDSTYGSTSDSSADLPALREMRLCGKCEGYLDKIQVAIVQVSAPLRVGDRVLFESESGGLFEQTLCEMQINREDVMTAYSGDDIGMKVKAVPKKNGNVYKVL